MAKFAGVFAFAYARPGGGLTHPELVPHVDAIVDAVAVTPGPGPVPPPVPIPPGPPPPPPTNNRVPATLKGPPPAPVAPPRSYPHINQIIDRPAAQSIRLLWDAHYALKAEVATTQATQVDHAAAIATVQTDTVNAQRTANMALSSTSDRGPTGGAPGPGGGGSSGGGGGGTGGGGGDTDSGQGGLGCSASGATGHITAGAPLTPYTMGLICCGTGHEFPALLAVVANQGIRDANRHELLGRMIWHLALAGFTSDYYPNNDYILLIEGGGIVYTYQVTDFAAFDVPLQTNMVFRGSGPGSILAPSGGVAD